MADLIATNRKPGTAYTDQEKQDTLILVLALGSVAQAAKRTGIARDSITKWMRADPVRMDKLKEDYKSHLDRFASNTIRAQNTEMLAIRQQLIDRMKTEIAQVTPDRLPEAIGRITLAYAQGFDKLRLAEGNPTSITEVRPVAEIARELETVLKQADIESTAESLNETPLDTEKTGI